MAANSVAAQQQGNQSNHGQGGGDGQNTSLHDVGTSKRFWDLDNPTARESIDLFRPRPKDAHQHNSFSGRFSLPARTRQREISHEKQTEDL